MRFSNISILCLFFIQCMCILLHKSHKFEFNSTYRIFFIIKCNTKIALNESFTYNQNICLIFEFYLRALKTQRYCIVKIMQEDEVFRTAGSVYSWHDNILVEKTTRLYSLDTSEFMLFVLSFFFFFFLLLKFMISKERKLLYLPLWQNTMSILFLITLLCPYLHI